MRHPTYVSIPIQHEEYGHCSISNLHTTVKLVSKRTFRKSILRKTGNHNWYRDGPGPKQYVTQRLKSRFNLFDTGFPLWKWRQPRNPFLLPTMTSQRGHRGIFLGYGVRPRWVKSPKSCEISSIGLGTVSCCWICRC